MRTPATPSGGLGQNKWGNRLQKRNLSPIPRRSREFVPAEKKDANYWTKREKNNGAAKKSRERRHFQDVELKRVVALVGDNERLRAELLTLKYRLGLTGVPPQFQTLRRSVLANLLPDLRTLRRAPILDAPSGGAPPFELGYRRAALPAFVAPPGPSREDGLCPVPVFRRPFSKDGPICPREKLHCVKCNAESSASSHLSKPQDRQLLRGSDLGSAVTFNGLQISGAQRDCPQRLGFKMSEDGESDQVQHRQSYLNIASSKGGLAEIFVDPHKTYFAADLYHHCSALNSEPQLSPNVDRLLQRRFLFPWGLPNHTLRETGFSTCSPINKSNAQKPDVQPICGRGGNRNGKETAQRRLNICSVEIDQRKRLLIPGSG